MFMQAECESKRTHGEIRQSMPLWTPLGPFTPIKSTAMARPQSLPTLSTLDAKPGMAQNMPPGIRARTEQPAARHALTLQSKKGLSATNQVNKMNRYQVLEVSDSKDFCDSSLIADAQTALGWVA
jgi:hypothetical protein